MGISKRRLAKIKADAFAILAAPFALAGAKSNAANVLRLAGVHELDIERALSPAEYAEPEPELSPGLGEAVAADLASRLTKLESRVGEVCEDAGATAKEIGSLDVSFDRLRGVVENARRIQNESTRELESRVAALSSRVAETRAGLRECIEIRDRADGSIRCDLGRIVEVGTQTAGEIERLEGRAFALEACVDMGRESRAELESRVEELEVNAEAFRARLDGGLETVKRPGVSVVDLSVPRTRLYTSGPLASSGVLGLGLEPAPIDCRGSGDPVDVSGWTNDSDLDLEPGASS